MKTIINSISGAVAAVLCCVCAVSAQTEWKIAGEAVPEGAQAVFVRNAANEKQFIFSGKLLDKPFAITDGTKTYVAECGDTDPLGDTIALAQKTGTETDLRLRYVKSQDYFKVILTVDGDNKTLTAEVMDLPKNLYIMGGPFNTKNSNWELQDIIALERDRELPYIFRYKGNIRYNEIGSEGGNFKLLRGYSWTDNFHPAGTGNVSLSEGLKAPLKMQMGEANGDGKWTVPADRSGDGYYELTINVLDMTLKVDKFEKKDLTDELPRVMYITGTSIPTGFSQDNTNPMRMEQTAPGVYEWGGRISVGEFKFQVKRGTYMYAYMALVNGTEIYSGQEYDVEYCESYFGQDHLDRKFKTTAEAQGKICLDLNRLKAWVEGQPEVPSKVETAEGVEVAYFSRDGKLYLTSADDVNMQARIFGVDGRMVAERTFVRTADVALPEGTYIVVLTGGNGKPATRLHTYVK